MEERGLHLAAGTIEERDGELWATILPVGEWKLRPGTDGRPVRKPLRVVEGRTTDPNEVGLQDLVDAYRDGAVQHVTIPLDHRDRVQDNTGFVEDVAIEDDPKLGRRALRAKLRFTEPLIKEKVKRGSIANRSCGILFDYLDKETEKGWRSVLGHLALTNKPWIKGMPPLADGLFSEDALYFDADGDADQPGEDDPPDQSPELDKLTDTLDMWSTGDLEVVAYDGKTALVRDEDGDLWRVPTKDDGTPEDTDQWELLDPENSDEAAAQLDALAAVGNPGTAETALSEPTNDQRPRRGGDHMGKYDNLTPEEIEARLDRAAALEAKDRVSTIDARIAEFSERGYDRFPGLLRVAREFMLADDGDVAVLMLAEDGSKNEVRVTGIVEAMLEAFPVEETTNLSEQTGHERQQGKRPDDDAGTDTRTVKQRADDARRALNIQSDLITT